MARAGVKNFYCTLNVDPLSIRALMGGEREQQQLVDLVRCSRTATSIFFASCALGREWDEKAYSGRTIDLFSKADIHTAEFFNFHPVPRIDALGPNGAATPDHGQDLGAL